MPRAKNARWDLTVHRQILNALKHKITRLVDRVKNIYIHTAQKFLYPLHAKNYFL